MTNLLCLKDNCGKYVRIAEDACELTSLSKATVFPVTQTAQVAELLEQLRRNRMIQLEACKTNLTPYFESLIKWNTLINPPHCG